MHPHDIPKRSSDERLFAEWEEERYKLCPFWLSSSAISHTVQNIVTAAALSRSCQKPFPAQFSKTSLDLVRETEGAAAAFIKAKIASGEKLPH